MRQKLDDYQWVADKVKSAVPDCELAIRLLDYDHCVQLGAGRNGKRHGFDLASVRSSFSTIPEEYEFYEFYSINSSEDKEREVNKIIERIKAM